VSTMWRFMNEQQRRDFLERFCRDLNVIGGKTKEEIVHKDESPPEIVRRLEALQRSLPGT
jgi:hypothetical protein